MEITHDETAFAAQAERHRRELQLHCYRMLGSFDESEDQVQETLLRAWRRRETFEGRSSLRAWLYRIATNTCLDALAARPRPRVAAGPGERGPAEVLWLQPYPDHLLEGVASDEASPEERVVARETVELAFLAAIQLLPPRQRAALLLRDVLGWSAKETAELLECSVASANSALQRARATLGDHAPGRHADRAAAIDRTEGERALLARYVEALERADMDAVATLLREDALLTMPPDPSRYVGRDAIVTLTSEFTFDPKRPLEWRLLGTWANGQPAAACYARGPGEERFEAVALDVLEVRDGEIVAITAFQPRLFAAFDLPASL